MTASDARVSFGTGGVADVESYLRLTDRSYLYCHTYGDRAPILSVSDAHVRVSFSVPDPDLVTGQDVAVVRRLAEVVAAYVTELEQLAARDEDPAEPGEPSGRAA